MKPNGIIEETRKLRISQYQIPGRIELVDGRLFWQPVNEWRTVKPTGETFNQFLDLANQNIPESAILKFARRWGVLCLCKEHLEPVSDVKHWKCMPLNSETSESPDGPAEAVPVWQKHFASEGEPVSEYRRWSRLAGAILRICEKHEDAETANAEDWQVLWNDRWFVQGDKEVWIQNIKWKGWDRFELVIEKAYMISALNRWLEIGNVRPRLVPSESTEPYLTIGADGLFGVLAVSLLQVAGNHVLAGCSGCRKFYTPNIKPKAGHPRYCQDCRDAGIPVARAKLRKQIGVAKPRLKTLQTKRAKTAPKR